jgi:hypothetical protein
MRRRAIPATTWKLTTATEIVVGVVGKVARMRDRKRHTADKAKAGQDDVNFGLTIITNYILMV